MNWKRWSLVLGALVAVGAGVVALVLSQKGAPAAQPHPNVLFVLWDTVRADRLSLYGHDRKTTPNLDRFADKAVVYEDVFSPGMWTVPSHGSMFTGLPAASHGASFDWRWLDHHHVTMAEWFGQHGYETFAFSANPNLSKRGANLLQGFQVIQTSWNQLWWPLVRRSTTRKLIEADASTEISPSYAGDKPGNQYYNGGVATERALNTWLDRRDGDKPFFAFLNYMEAHKPRVPAQRFRDQVMPADLQPVALSTDMSYPRQLGYGVGAVELTETEIEAARAVYDASIRELDFFFGRLTTLLHRRGLADDTIVVVTSDHGETLGEHHRFGHRHGVYQTLLHVPLVIRYPRKLKPARVKDPVTTMDLFATLTELADLPMVDGTLSRSLVDEAREAVFAEVLSYDHAGLSLARKLFPDVELSEAARTYRTVREGRYKLIVDDRGVKQLFDLHEDAHEAEPLDDPERTAALAATMDAWWSSIPPYDPSKRTDRDRPVITNKDKDMLEALGYIIEDDE